MKINLINKYKKIKIEKIENYINIFFLTKKKLEINIKTTTSEDIKKINKKYRNKNLETDVLTFKNNKISKTHKVIGDIILCPKIIKNQIKSIVIHSMLHLLNYDHYEKKDFIIMSKIEKKIGMSGIEPPTITTSK